MPPKAKITEMEILDTAVRQVRENGADSLNARALAQSLGCSTQPIFSNFSSMEKLRSAVINSAQSLYEKYLSREISENKYPAYKASGMGYIRFAKEEKELFKLLFMRDRSFEPMALALQHDPVIEITQKATGYSYEKAERFHLEMWVVVHGIASMIATNYLDWDMDMASGVLTDMYRGLRMRFDSEV
ncbi:MAG: WHG domain-containing protein [Oscillospiraceae bacterium]|nr:WHG domain-containing protein [Oscillospiraceae bacterium]